EMPILERCHGLDPVPEPRGPRIEDPFRDSTASSRHLALMIRFLTVEELASALELPEDLLESAVRDGLVEAVETDEAVLIDLEDLPDSLRQQLKDLQQSRACAFE